MLHIVNGDVHRQRLVLASIPGTPVVWAEVLHEGPCPAATWRHRWREVRARFYEELSPGSTHQENLTNLEAWDLALESAQTHDEIVLWVEDDLFDQLLLIRHLAWFDELGIKHTQLAWVDLARDVPAAARNQGSQPARAMHGWLASLLERRKPITQEQMSAGLSAWRAFTSQNPTEVQAWIDSASACWPWLAAALERHLEEFPSTRTGLSRIEGQALHCLASRGPMTLSSLFTAATLEEERPFLADTTFLWLMRKLAQHAQPLVEWTAMNTWRLTPLGLLVHHGAVDRVRTCGIDRWRGGVHLGGFEAAWRWDPAQRRLIAT